MTVHKLLTKELIAKIPKLYSQENVKDPLVITKFFHPFHNWRHYVIEYDGEDTFFGLVDGFEQELGNFSLQELSDLRVHGCPTERDLYFTPIPLSKLREEIKRS